MDLKKVNKWKVDMICECGNHSPDEVCQRKKIVDNFEKELNVKKEIEEIFIDCLFKEAERHKCDTVIESIYEIQKKNKHLMLKGSKIKELRSTHAFIRSAKTIHRIVKNTGPTSNNLGLYEKKSKPITQAEKIVLLINEGLLSKDDFVDEIGNKLGFTWATFADELAEQIENSTSADEIRDQLGLDFSIYAKDEYLIRFVFKTGFLSDYPSLPTVVEAGDSVPFKPSLMGSETGYAIDLKTGKRTLPEVVHEPLKNPSQNLIDFDVTGKTKNDPPQGYLKDFY